MGVWQALQLLRKAAGRDPPQVETGMPTAGGGLPGAPGPPGGVGDGVPGDGEGPPGDDGTFGRPAEGEDGLGESRVGEPSGPQPETASSPGPKMLAMTVMVACFLVRISRSLSVVPRCPFR